MSAVVEMLRRGGLANLVAGVLAACVLADVALDSALITTLMLSSALLVLFLLVVRRVGGWLSRRQPAQGTEADGGRPTALATELSRARRYERPVSVVKIGLKPGELPWPGAAGLRSALCLRTEDSFWVDGSEVFVVLPETEREGACRFTGRLIDLDLSWLDLANAAVVSFPDDGLTVRALLTRPRPTVPRRVRAEERPADDAVTSNATRGPQPEGV